MPAKGRPTKYKTEYNEQVRKLALMGCTDEEMADIISVSVSTFYKWKVDHIDFSEAIKEGKAPADANVAASLYHRAIGYTHPEEKIFNNQGEEMRVQTTKYYAPDVAAAFIWLKNRQPDKWRDKKETDMSADSLVEAFISISEKLPD